MIGVAVMALLQLTLDRRSQPSSAWLVVAAGAVTAMGLSDVAAQLGAGGVYRVLKPFGDAALLVIGPALWLYVRQAGATPSVNRDRWRSTLLHLAPAGIVWLLLAVLAVLGPPEPRETHRSPGELVTLMPIAVQLVAYAIALAFRITSIRRRTMTYYSDLEGRDLGWILVMTALYIAALAAWILTWRWSVAASNALTGLFVTAATAWLGIRGSRQRIAVAPAQTQVQTSEPGTGPSPGTPPPTGERYARARLTGARAEDIGAQLAAVMGDDKAYLESDLTLADLAGRAGATTHQLSQYLSTHRQQSFYDYVNGWRVEAVKATLMRPGSAHRPLIEVALECGFGSKSAFNSVFKRATGLSPSEYRTGLPATAGRPPGRSTP